MTPEEQARAKEICEKATPGPWFREDECGWLIRRWQRDDEMHVLAMDWAFKADAEFCAESRDLLPKAIAEIEKLQSDINKLLAYDSECKKILAQVDIGVVGQSLPERCRQAVQRILPCDHDKSEGWLNDGKIPEGVLDGFVEGRDCIKCEQTYYRVHKF